MFFIEYELSYLHTLHAYISLTFVVIEEDEQLR